MNRRDIVAVVTFCIATLSGCAERPPVPSGTLETRAEQTAFEETSGYADVRAFIDALARETPKVRVEMFGRSEEGRDLPLLVIGDPPAPAPPPRSARLPVVFVMANIHAGEVEGKEAALHLARRLTVGDLQSLLPSAIWLFAPIYNADGNERISFDNRVEQNGPIGGVGTRENAMGLDLNRDFTKLESSEARSLVALLAKWDPDVVMDLHTTNGSFHGYHLTYAPPLSPNTDGDIASFTRERLLPAVREAMSTRHRFRTYEYGTFATADAMSDELKTFAIGETRRKVWQTFDARPRFGTNYVGLRNRIAILSEAYSYLDFKRRIEATEAFAEEIMRFVAANGDAIRSLTTAADSRWTRGDAAREQGIASAIESLPEPASILAGTIRAKVNPRSGKTMWAMDEETAVPMAMTVYDGFEPTATRRVPAEYIVLESADGLDDVVESKLREHGIAVERTTVGVRRSVEQLAIASIDREARTFQGHNTVSVEGALQSRDVDVPAGSLIVRTNQPLGRLVFYLLEPESDDGLTTWNFLDEALKSGLHPVLKSMP
jgi:zinc carboxypeptidase